MDLTQTTPDSFDVHSAPSWSILEKYTSIPVEHILIERIKQNKSLVDIRLTARACQEHYENKVDSFVTASSDSDYWGLISSLPKAQFLVMIENDKCGPDMKEALANSEIFYCYLDDFYSGDSEELKTNALFQEMRSYMEKAIHLNANDMFAEALRTTRIEMPLLNVGSFSIKISRHYSCPSVKMEMSRRSLRSSEQYRTQGDLRHGSGGPGGPGPCARSVRTSFR